MDQFSRKDRKSAIDSSKAVSLLIVNLEKAVKVKGVQLKECQELKKLKEKCCSDNVCEAFAAFQGITMLVEKRILIGSQTLSLLISLLPSVTHYTPLVMTIGDILLFENEEHDGKDGFQYNFTDKLHPFIIVLKHDIQKSWDAIFSYIQVLFYNYKTVKFTSKIHMLKSAIHYVFVDPAFNSLSYKYDILDLLLEEIDEPQIKFLVVELLTWQNIDMNYCKLIKKTLNCLLNSPKAERKDVIIGLTPCLAAAIKWLILNAHNPILWIDLLSKSLEFSKDGCSAVLYILSDVFLETPPFFTNKLAEICTSIIYSFSCNKFIAHKFAAVSLIWMVNPTPLSPPLLKTLETVIKFLVFKCKSSDWNNTTSNLFANPYFKIIKNSSGDAKIAVDMAVLTDSWGDKSSVLKSLKNLSKSNNLRIQTSLQTVISGIVLSENDDEILDTCLEILLKISMSDSVTCHFYLCLMFYKLSRETEPKRQLKYLLSLTEMAKSKENVSLIIGIIEILKGGSASTMWPVIIDLYLKLWKTDKRTYPHLHKALSTCSSYCENSWELSIIKTVAMREICKISPEIHGKGLVSKLSEVLNDCDNYESGIPSATAIEAVIELCKASVIDIAGTWRALKPKLSRDTRTEVIISLCMLFSEIPSLKSPGLERDALINDVIPRLWHYAFSTNLELVKAALASLSKFNAESYGPKLLPNILKKDIDLPRQYLKSSKEISKDEILDQLQYIPGECWIEFLHKIDSRVMTEAGNMLQSLIEEELQSLPRRHFCLAEEMPEPQSYAHLPHSSICRAVERHIKNYLNSLSAKENKVPPSVTEILRILSLDYSKCLPCLDWSFLNKFFTLGDECRKYSVLILVRQSPASKAGKKAFECYVANNLSKLNDVNEYIYLYSVLGSVCNSLGADILRQFLDKTITSSCNSSVHAGTDHFSDVLKYIRSTLEGKIISEPRKALLIAHIQNFVTHIPPEHKIMKVYADFATGLPPKTVECITSPASWTKITSEKIRRSVCIKMAAVVRTESLQPMAPFDEVIDAVGNFPGECDLVINCILEVLQKRRNVCHANWLLELIWKIQTSTSSVNTAESVKVISFLLDIFIIATITISGYDFLLQEQEAQAMRDLSLNIFPVALCKLLEMSDYSFTSQKILDCIHSLSKWKKMPEVYTETLVQSILTNRSNKYCLQKNKWQQLLCIPMELKCQ